LNRNAESPSEMNNKAKIPDHIPPTETILQEITKETELIKSINGAIGQLEETAENLEQEIINCDNGDDRRANKWRERYHSQVRINEQLENERAHLKEELENERIKITNGWSKYPHVYEFEEDMSEAELQRLIRQLEMVRHNLVGELSDARWRLDQHSNNYHQLNDQCQIYKLEINNAKANTMKRRQIKYVDQRIYTFPGMMAGSIQRHLSSRNLPPIDGDSPINDEDLDTPENN